MKHINMRQVTIANIRTTYTYISNRYLLAITYYNSFMTRIQGRRKKMFRIWSDMVSGTSAKNPWRIIINRSISSWLETIVKRLMFPKIKSWITKKRLIIVPNLVTYLTNRLLRLWFLENHFLLIWGRIKFHEIMTRLHKLF